MDDASAFQKPDWGGTGLHHCQAAAADLFERADLYETIYGMALEHPEILEFHGPAYR